MTAVEIARTGVTSLLVHKVRTIVVIATLFAVILPYIAGMGVSQGLQRDATASVRYGADLYVGGEQFGRMVPVPRDALQELRSMEGVQHVTPRIVGTIPLGQAGENVILIGLPADDFPASVSCITGRMPRAAGPHEFVVGTELQKRLQLSTGASLPPFYRNPHGERVSKIVGVFKSEISLWQSHVMLTTLDSAAVVFNQPDLITDFLITCRPGYESQVGNAILRSSVFGDPRRAGVRPRVVSRAALYDLLPEGLLHRDGIFSLHFLIAFAAGIGIVLVTSGFGLSERRREVGILKATGWQTDEILMRGFVENLLIALIAASAAVIAAFVWLKWLNGMGVAGIFLGGVGGVPTFQVPFHLGPIPALLAFLISVVLVMSGALYSTWRAAVVPPFEALR